MIIEACRRWLGEVGASVQSEEYIVWRTRVSIPIITGNGPPAKKRATSSYPL